MSQTQKELDIIRLENNILDIERRKDYWIKEIERLTCLLANAKKDFNTSSSELMELNAQLTGLKSGQYMKDKQFIPRTQLRNSYLRYKDSPKFEESQAWSYTDERIYK